MHPPELMCISDNCCIIKIDVGSCFNMFGFLKKNWSQLVDGVAFGHGEVWW